jgi:hypothetical protein
MGEDRRGGHRVTNRSVLEIADVLWTKGAGHLIGATALVDVSREFAKSNNIDDADQFVFNGRYSASVHLLIGFAAELLLKSAFVLSGGDPDRLRQRDLGHNLKAILDAAEFHGFQANISKIHAVIENLTEPHLQHQFRYEGARYVYMPELHDTITVLEMLAYGLRAMLQEQGM